LKIKWACKVDNTCSIANQHPQRQEKHTEIFASKTPVLFAHGHAGRTIVIIRRISFGQRAGSTGLLLDRECESGNQTQRRENREQNGLACLGSLQGAQLPPATA
jgi:hypothetical protein